MKFAFCGFDFFDSSLYECLACGHQLMAGFSQKVDGVYNLNNNIKASCNKASAPFYERNMESKDVVYLHENGCQLVIAAAYAYKLPASELNTYGIKGINIHPTLLPEGRGPWPLPWLILKQSTKSGVTLHKLSNNFDKGDILLQKSFPLYEQDNLETLTFKCRAAAALCVRELLGNLDMYWANAVKQDVGSYWPMPKETDRTLSWDQSIETIQRIVRAFGKYESYVTFDQKDWLIQDVSVWKDKHSFPIGSIVDRTDKEVLIAAMDGFVCIRQFKQEPTI